MVKNERKKIGFIVEGGSEKVIIESRQFKAFLKKHFSITMVLSW